MSAMVGDVLWVVCCSVAIDVSNARVDIHLLQAHRHWEGLPFRPIAIVDRNACVWIATSRLRAG
jgi:hypothetical protein